MVRPTSRALTVLLATTSAGFFPEAAYAYGGPGSVVSGIGALLAGVAALGAAVFGFIWFPLKRVYRAMKSDDGTKSTEAETG